MKRFDQLAFYQRLVQRLQISNDWAQVLNEGTIGALLNTIADGGAELARYLEFLYQEKKFRNARTMSAVTHQADLVAYKRQLPKSAVGYVIVSHTDAHGNNRLSDYGVYYFDINAESNYDTGSENLASTVAEKAALVPWTNPIGYTIPKGTIFKTADGINFVSTESVSIKPWTKNYNTLTAAEKEEFINNGGWNGYKYLKVPVIQGEITTNHFGLASGSRFESFAIDHTNVEAGINILSEQFFKVKVLPNGAAFNDYETWEKIENIGLAGPNDKVFEVSILENEDKVMIKFGDGITGALLPANAQVSVEYLTTAGSAGNVTEKFQITQMSLPEPIIDPRTNQYDSFLSCTNIVPVMGGKAIEDINDIKLHAPVHHLTSYATGTKESILRQIVENSPIELLTYKLFSSNVIDQTSYGIKTGTNSPSGYFSTLDNSATVVQEITSTKNALVLTALKANGTLIEDPEEELLSILRKELEEILSPNDVLKFMQPNLVRIRQNVIIYTEETVTQTTAENDIKNGLLEDESIFRREFGDTYYESHAKDIVHNFGYVKDSKIMLEALATTSLKPDVLAKQQVAFKTSTGFLSSSYLGNSMTTMAGYTSTLEDNTTLLAFKFKFDDLFKYNVLKPGFKNYKNDKHYVIRANVKFGDDDTKNRTFILVDNRKDNSIQLSLEEAYCVGITDDLVNSTSSITYPTTGETVVFENSFQDHHLNCQTRTAQFPYVSNIITDEIFKKMVSPSDISSYLKEYRPLEYDANGKNIKTSSSNIGNIPAANRVSTNYGAYSSGDAYKRDFGFITKCKLEFNENYNGEGLEDFASGRLILPLQYVCNSDDIAILRAKLSNISDYDVICEQIYQQIKNNVSIEVFAEPINDTIYCKNENDLIYTTRDDISVEVQRC